MVTIEQALNSTALSMLSLEDFFGRSFDSGEKSAATSSFQIEWTKIQARFRAISATTTTSAEAAAAVGLRLRTEEGLQAKHPVFMMPGFVTSGLELWEGQPCAFPTYFRKKIWGSLETFRSFVGDRECWKVHLSLDPITGQDPPGIRLRNADGFQAADWWTGAFWVWDRIIRNLAAIGYDGNNMKLVPFDWRMDYEMLEARDGTFTKLKKEVEAYVQLNDGHKAVIMGHSMGGQTVFAFLVWADKQEEGWCEKFVHSYLDISGPLLGLPKAASALLSGEMKDTNALAPMSGMIESLFGRKRRQELFSSWGSLWSMAPLGGDAIWGTAADVNCGEGKVHAGATCVNAKNEDGTRVTPSIPFLTFTDESPEVEEGDDSIYATYARKSSWNYTDILDYLGAWKKGHRGPESLNNAWNDVTKDPLPNAPSMNVYCMYGYGLPTERMFHYGRNGADVDGDVSFVMTAVEDNPLEGIQLGIKMTMGDGSVPLLSLGYAFAELWKEGSHLNPGNARVTTREYQHQGSFQIDDPLRQGPTSSEHCDILGNHELIEDIIRIATGSQVEPVVVSDIHEIAKKIREHPFQNSA